MFRKQACICLRSTGNWWNTRLMTEDTGNPGSVKEPVESLLNTEGDKNLSTGWISAKKSQRFQCGVLSLGMSVIAGQVKDTVQKTYNASQLHVGWNYFISACICLTIIRDWQKKKKTSHRNSKTKRHSLIQWEALRKVMRDVIHSRFLCLCLPLFDRLAIAKSRKINDADQNLSYKLSEGI